jgi:integrase
MPIVKLDARSVALLKLAACKDDAVYWDAEVANFGYRLRRRGKHVRKTWIVQYQNRNRDRRRFTFAPGELSATAARKQAAELLARIKLGYDPQGEIVVARTRGALNFRAVVDDFLAAHEGAWRSGTAKQYRHILLTYCQPLHALGLDEVTRAHIAPLLTRVEKERGRRSASLTRARLFTLYIWAIEEGRVDVNPIIGTRKVRYDEKRDRVLSDEELTKLWHACDQEHFLHGGNFGRAVKLLILTGCRRREITGMQWRELDFEKGIWTLPAERSKNGRAHVLPLVPAIRAVLDEVQRERWDGRDWEADEYVFSTKGAMNVNRPLEAVYERCGFSNWWLHDLRRSVATGMANLGILPHVIECVLNHVSGFRAGVGGVYNRASYEREVAQALQRWSEHVLALAEGRAEKVVPLHA